MHADLVVPRESIQEAKEPTPLGVVYQGVDAGQRVGVIGTSFIKICEIHTHPPLPAGLLGQHYVRQPLWVLYLPDVASAQQLLGLFSEDLSLIIVELSSSLADRSKLWIHGDAMAREIGVDAGHV